MIIHIGVQLGEDKTCLRDFYAVHFDGSAVHEFPWGQATFDCIVAALDFKMMEELAQEFATQAVQWKIDWVQTTGHHAEYLHDLIDDTAVKMGIQQNIGDGFPMTTWHSDAQSLREIIDVALICFGGSDYVLCAVVGNEKDFQQFIQDLKRELERF